MCGDVNKTHHVMLEATVTSRASLELDHTHESYAEGTSAYVRRLDHWRSRWGVLRWAILGLCLVVFPIVGWLISGPLGLAVGFVLALVSAALGPLVVTKRIDHHHYHYGD